MSLDSLLANTKTISYFELDEYLDTLKLDAALKARVKEIEYNNRLKYVDNPRYDIIDPKFDGDITELKILYHYEIEGKLHREGGPARCWSTGLQEWFINNKYHNESGPAKFYNLNAYEWWLNGVRHRDDGPAVVSQHAEEWFQHGRHHREDGPAYTWDFGNGTIIQEWLIHGVPHRVGGPSYIETGYMREWMQNGKFHNPDGPAMVFDNG